MEGRGPQSSTVLSWVLPPGLRKIRQASARDANTPSPRNVTVCGNVPLVVIFSHSEDRPNACLWRRATGGEQSNLKHTESRAI